MAPAGSQPIPSTSAIAPETAPTASSPGAPAPPAPALDMHATIESLRATVAIAAGRGGAHARIALSPPELGQIRVHISRRPDGALVTRIVADTQAGAQALSAGRSELMHELGSLGSGSLSIEVGAHAPGQHGGARDQQMTGRGEQGRDRWTEEGTETPDQDGEQPVRVATGARGSSSLVDVLA